MVGALSVARQALRTKGGKSDVKIISFDMGGTSTDVSLIAGDYHVTTEGSVADCPVHVPMMDIHTVGAGGGSIAHVDAGGALRVGPQSAGAQPGPARDPGRAGFSTALLCPPRAASYCEAAAATPPRMEARTTDTMLPTQSNVHTSITFLTPYSVAFTQP